MVPARGVIERTVFMYKGEVVLLTAAMKLMMIRHPPCGGEKCGKLRWLVWLLKIKTVVQRKGREKNALDPAPFVCKRRP